MRYNGKMLKLMKKMFRDLLEIKVQIFSVFMMTMLGMAIYTGIEGVWNGMEHQGKSYFKETNLADLWVNGLNISKEDLNEVILLDDVKDAELSQNILSHMKASGEEEKEVKISSLKEKDSISTLHVVEGEKYCNEDNSVWLNYDFANTNNIKLDDVITLNYNKKEVELKVKGLVYSPECISYKGTSSSNKPNHENYGYCFVSEETMKNLCNILVYNQIKIKTVESYQEEKLKSDIASILKEKYISCINKGEFSGVSEYNNKIIQIRKMSIMFSIMFFVLALMTIDTTMKRIVRKQRVQIGTLKALGFSDTQIRMHYALYGFVISCLGCVIGVALAPYTITPVLLKLQGQIYSIPYWQGSNTIIPYVASVLIIIFCTTVAISACNKEVKELPAEILRESMPKANGKMIIENISSLWNSLSFDWKWSLRDISRNKARTIIGIIGVLGSMVLLMASFGIRDSIKEANKNLYGKQYSYNSKINFSYALLEEDKKKIEETFIGDYQWIYEGATEIKSSNKIKSTTLILADEGYYFKLYDKKGIVPMPEEGAIISETLAEEMKITEGDTINISFKGENSRIRTCVSKVVPIECPQGVFMSKDAWIKSGGNFKPSCVLLGYNKESEEISKLDFVNNTVTLQEQLNDADSILESVDIIIKLLLGAAILLSCVILYNLGLLNYIERYREYATLKVLGFHDFEVKQLIFKDSIFNMIIGIILGIPIGNIFLNMYVKVASTSNFQYKSHLTMTSLIISLGITIGCSLIINMIVCRKVRKIDMVEALKSVD